MKTANDVLKFMKDNDVKYVDCRFTDPRGKWQHVTFDVSLFDQDAFAEGVMFDGSSIAGWKPIHESDMNLMPDPESACIDPFFAETTLSIVCDVLEPTTGEPYTRDPRGISKKAVAYMKSTGVGDIAYFGPEAEFFIFDDVRFSSDPYNTGFRIDSIELPTNMGTEYEGGNLGHRMRTKGGYFPVPPQDSAQDMRSEMLGSMAKMGVAVEKHHHEVAAAQHELGMKFSPLVKMADQMQIYKYCIHMVAKADLRRQRIGHALPSIDLEGLDPGIRRQQVRRSIGYLPQLYRRRHQTRPRDQRLHQPDDQLIQAVGARL
jgi:glutamine synthetase